MSWGIEFKADIYLSRQSYSSKGEVEDRMEELDKEINDYETELKMYAISQPRDVVPDDEDQISWINNRINEILESYRECVNDRFKLYLYLEYLNDAGEIIKAE